MKSLTFIALLAITEATQLTTTVSSTPVSWSIAPHSLYSHDLYCKVFGHDPTYGPCPVAEEGEELSRDPYPPGYFENIEDQDDQATQEELPVEDSAPDS